jgi:hypothetical protein
VLGNRPPVIGDLLTSVVLALHSAGLRAEDLRPETANLEDAFLALVDETDRANTTGGVPR